MNEKGRLRQSALIRLLGVIVGLMIAGNTLAAQRVLEIQGPVILQGQTGTAIVKLEAQGDENGVGFSLAFDPTVVSYTGASLGVDASSASATMVINANQAANGQLGIILVLPSDIGFSAGTRQLLNVNFQAVTAASLDSAISFTDKPVPRDVSDTNAISLVATYVNGTISVNPKPPSLPSVTVAPANLLIAAGSAVTLTATASGTAPLFYQWMFGGAPIGGATKSTYNIAPVQATNSGSYLVVVSNAAGSVTSAPPSVLAVFTWTNPAAVSYGTPLGSDQLNAVATLPGTFDYSPTSGTVLGTGTHALSVIFSPIDTLDYGSFTDTVSLVVAPAPVTISSGLRADDKVYDGTTSASLSSNNVMLAGVLASDAGSVALLTNGYSANFVGRSAGTGKSITVTGLALTGSAAGNYALVQPAALTASIEPRPLTILAAAHSKVYDGTTSATVTLSDARVMGDNLSESYSSAAFGDANAGTGKLVIISGISLSGLDTANYTFDTTMTSTADITSAPLGITANNTNKIYGQAVSFSGKEFTVTGLANGDAVTGVSLSSTGADATALVAGSPYGIVASGATGSGLANYNISYHNGNLIVSQATLVEKADDTNRLYGMPNPPFTGTLTGVQNGDNITASFSCRATNTSPAGQYAIVATLDDPQGKLTNYAVTVFNAILTVISPPEAIGMTLLHGQALLLSVQSVNGFQYVLESKEDLNEPAWNAVQTNSGTGGIVTFSNYIGANPFGFYRIGIR